MYIFDLYIDNLVNNNKKNKNRSIYLLQYNTTFLGIAIYNFENNFEIQYYNFKLIFNLMQSY